MPRFFMSLYSLFVCIFIMNPLTAVALTNRQDVKQDLRILELLPSLLCPLAVDPAIPADFIALSPEGISNLHDWIYWGPEDVLKDYFEDPTSLKVPLIRVKLCPNIAQTGPKSFPKSFIKYLKKLKQENPKGFAFIESQWGDYPVLAIRDITEGWLNFVGWVGLNDPEAGWTLIFNLVYPHKKDHPNKKDRQLWKNLLIKTTQLKEGDYFKACGQDLQEGYTLVNVGGVKLKMIAEKRQRDGALQVVVIPETPGIEFHYTDMMECAMGSKWKQGEPMVKVYGEIVVDNKDLKAVISHVTSIFFKTVPNFSFKEEDGKKSFVFQKSTLWKL